MSDSSSRRHEPKYQTLDRLIKAFELQRTDNTEEIEELRMSVQLLKISNKDLNDGLSEARRKIKDYELRLGIITIEDAQLREKNENDIASGKQFILYDEREDIVRVNQPQQDQCTNDFDKAVEGYPVAA